MLKFPRGCAEDCEGNKNRRPNAATVAHSFRARLRAENRPKTFDPHRLASIVRTFPVSVRRIGPEQRQSFCGGICIEDVKMWINSQSASEIILRFTQIAQPLV